jgi:hypothetical protein
MSLTPPPHPHHVLVVVDIAVAGWLKPAALTSPLTNVGEPQTPLF